MGLFRVLGSVGDPGTLHRTYRPDYGCGADGGHHFSGFCRGFFPVETHGNPAVIWEHRAGIDDVLKIVSE